MNYNTLSLSEELYEEYTSFLKSTEHSLFYVSLSYKLFLEKLLGCKSAYFLAIDLKDKVVGSFPVMIKKNQIIGNIANSLPYYGSNGGILLDSSKPRDEQQNIRMKLLHTVERYVQEQNCVASTFVTSPFEREQKWFKDNYTYDFIDQRIGQITPLPRNTEKLSGQLLKMFENPRPRNIRKAIKSRVTFHVSYKPADLEFLCETHQQNISAIGGLYKTDNFFSLLPEMFDKKEYQIYIAEKDGERIAGLLLFYFNKTVEYFTPAIKERFRTFQPVCLLIFEAMKDAVQKGYRYWNWGGTQLSQEGVYNFKKKWGTKDYLYFYYTKIYDQSILQHSKAELIEQYPNFYVAPFNVLMDKDTI